MIVIDTSAIVAILEQEPDAGKFIRAIERSPNLLMSAATYVELCAVMQHKRGDGAPAIVDEFLNEAGIGLEAVTPLQGKLASDAHARFKKLNFGDTFAYALAKEKRIPLLFKGQDFIETDIKIAA